jgi:cell division septal protein FtsQ
VKVKAPTERNFRRAKVKPGRRKASRARLPWRLLRSVLTALIVGYGVYRGYALVLDATALHVGRINVTGNARLSRGEVLQLVHGLQGANLLTADLARFRRALLDSPWVADATLRRVLPSTVEIAVVERQPFGIGRLGKQLYLVDRDGTIIDEFGPQHAEFDLPIVDGLTRASRRGQPAIDPTRARLASHVIDSLAGTPLARRVSQVDVSDVHNAAVLLDDDPVLLYLGEDRFRERLQSYLEVADAIRAGVPSAIDYIDLRFGQRVFAKQRRSAAGAGRKPAKGRPSD